MSDTEVTPARIQILRLCDVVAKTNMCGKTITRKMAARAFPQSFKLGERANGWYEHEVDAWIAMMAAKRAA